jgi:hypothetical protein
MSASTSIQNFCVGIVCAWALLPQLAYSGVARLLALGAVGIWLLIEAAKSQGIIRRPTLPLLALLVFALYTLLFELMTHGASGVVNRIQIYIMAFFLVVQQSRRKQVHTLHPIFWWVIILSAIAMTTTYIYLSTVDARVMRTIVRSSKAAEDLVGQGVGGYAMAYGAVLMLPVLIVLSLRPALIDRLQAPPVLSFLPFAPKILIWYLTGLSILLVLSSQFTTAVMILGVCMTLVMVLWTVTVFRIFLAMFLVVLLLLFFEALVVQLLSYLAHFVEGTNYEPKINDMLISLQMDDAGGTVSDRLDRYRRSFLLFLGHPFTGVLYFTDIGKHSTLLDTFARWGGAIGLIFLYIVSFLQIRALRYLSSISGGVAAALGSLAAVLMVFGLNSAFMSAGIIIFIIHPLVFEALGRPPVYQQDTKSMTPYA